MRAPLLLLLSGCSLIYDGSDLKGKAASRPKWTSTMFVAGADTRQLAVGDLDGDGKVDLVAANHSDNTLTVLMNQGGAQFSPSTVQSCVGPIAPVVGDFGGSKDVDLLVACNDELSSPEVSSLALHVGASGTLGGPDPVSLGTPALKTPAAAASADLTGDGKPEVVLSYYDSDQLLILSPDMNGGWIHSTVTTGANPEDLTLADLDGNGSLDVAVANSYGDSFSVAFNQGNGAFSSPTSYPTHGQPWGIAAGDFDKKNGVDLAVAAYSLGQLDVMLALGPGSFPASLPTSLDLPVSPRRMRTGDLDGDGKIDLIISAYVDPEVMIYYGKGDGTFDDVVEVPAVAAEGLQVADLDGDGKLDIALSSDGQITILMNR